MTRFYKRRDQAALIWDAKKGEKGAVIIEFKKQKRDPRTLIDGYYDTDKKGDIKLLKDMGYEYDEKIPMEDEELEAPEFPNGEKEG